MESVESALTVKEIALDQGKSYVTVLKWIQTGKLKGIRKGGAWEVPRSEYERFKVEGNRERGAE